MNESVFTSNIRKFRFILKKKEARELFPGLFFSKIPNYYMRLFAVAPNFFHGYPLCYEDSFAAVQFTEDDVEHIFYYFLRLLQRDIHSYFPQFLLKRVGEAEHPSHG